MKTYLPQIEQRIYVRPNQTFGILNYDLDNAYPQRMLALVGQSPTAKSCWGKRAKFIGGNGFEYEEKSGTVTKRLGDIIINKKGVTLNKLLKAVATDKALFTGFAIHVNYNANYKVASAHYVRFEDVRMGDIDEPEYKGKFVLYSDWGKKTWKSIYRSKLTVLNPFNPDPDVIKNEVIEAGGWENYKGQLYYFNPEIDDYPLIEADEVWEDFETEAGIKIFNNREVTTGFFPSTIIKMMARRENADMKGINADQEPYFNRPTEMDRNLATFQSAKEAQKILVLEYEDPENPPEITPYNIQNNDRLFQSTEESVESRIIKGFKIPKELINSEKSSGLTNGGEKKEAIREFNDITKPERQDIITAFTEIFSLWWEPLPNNGNWNILAIPDNVADVTAGSKMGAAINILLLTDMPAENKVWNLVYTYGFNEAEARQMVPPDGEFTPINPKFPGTSTTGADDTQDNGGQQ